MTSSDGGSGPDPIDPAFAGLFRPEPPAAMPGYNEEPMFEAIDDPVIDPRLEEAPDEPEVSDLEPPDSLPDESPQELPVEPGAAAVVPTDPVADTGRLFRSRGVTGHDEAVLALASDHFGRLRTLDRRDDAEPVPILDDAGPVPSSPSGDPNDDPGAEDAVVEASRRRRGRRPAVDDPGSRRRPRGITGGAVYLIVIGVTLLVAFANALIADGDLGWPTGLALLVSSVYAALTVRRQDDTAAMIVPPIAFLVAAMTAGQLFLGSAEGSLINRTVVVFFALADNWMWIIGTTVSVVAIVLVRRRRT